MARTRSGSAPAHRLQIADTAEQQLSAALSWVAVASGGRLTQRVIDAAMRHHRATRCEPAILIAAAVQYLVTGSDREDDHLNRYWHIADQTSARERARYLNTEESELL